MGQLFFGRLPGIMTYFQAIILGIVQGLSEFLPISSSAHLILVRNFAQWPDPGLAFDVALHWGTLIAVLIYFRTDLVTLIQNFLASLSGNRKPENKMPWQIILGTLPAVILGLALETKVETLFRSPWVIAITLSVLGIALFLADKKREDRFSLSQLSWAHAFLIGASQGFAVIPGVSRSGISITIGLLLGLNRASAVQFSFLLSIPIIFGAGVHEIKAFTQNILDPTLFVGIAASAIAGFIAIYFLMNYIRSKSFTPFVIYRLVLAAVIVVWLLTGESI
jgi:undecaprenyl-diphosphatase